MPSRSQQSEPARQPPATRRWLQHVFIEDWSLKLLALAITLTLWVAVTGQRTTVRRQLRGVQLTFHAPTDMEISNNPREEVEVILSGLEGDLDQASTRHLVAVVDVTSRKPGERVIQLTPGHVQIELPSGVRLEGIEPNAVLLKLEPRIERDLVVEPRLEGTPESGFELKEVVVTPNKVRVWGPASHVNALLKASTETISIAGRRESFDSPQTAIYIADPKVDVIDTANVHVKIGAGGSTKSKSRETN